MEKVHLSKVLLLTSHPREYEIVDENLLKDLCWLSEPGNKLLFLPMLENKWILLLAFILVFMLNNFYGSIKKQLRGTKQFRTSPKIFWPLTEWATGTCDGRRQAGSLSLLFPEPRHEGNDRLRSGRAPCCGASPGPTTSTLIRQRAPHFLFSIEFLCLDPLPRGSQDAIMTQLWRGPFRSAQPHLKTKKTLHTCSSHKEHCRQSLRYLLVLLPLIHLKSVF